MATSNLNLHSGGQLLSLEELALIKAPPPEGRWVPVPHAQVFGRVKETLDAAGYHVVNQQLAVHRDGNRFFGVMDLGNSVSNGVALAVGIRSSYDKSFPLGFAAGSRVFVCSNLAFRAELMVRRKHTLNGERRFNHAIAEAVSKLSSFQEEEYRRINLLQNMEMPDVLAESLILRAYERGVIGTHQLPKVLKEWREPSFEAFTDRTAWALFNAFTTVLTERSVTQPQAFVASTMQLHHLLEFQRGETDVPQTVLAT